MLTNINGAVNHITQQLAQHSSSPRLDAELLVACCLRRSRASLFAHLDQSLTPEQQTQLTQFAARRLAGEPMAYILGHKEFWALKLKVTPDVLIPRPETEHIIEWVLAQFPASKELCLADLGTGSGAIALALAIERPLWQIDATDFSLPALTIAKQNATQHDINNVNFYLGHWCAALPKKNYPLIISNPPYIAENDSHLTALSHEPQPALRAGADGLDAIREIIAQAPNYLAKPSFIVLEHGYDQAKPVISLLKQAGFTDTQSHRDLSNQPRFVTARYQ